MNFVVIFGVAMCVPLRSRGGIGSGALIVFRARYIWQEPYTHLRRSRQPDYRIYFGRDLFAE